MIITDNEIKIKSGVRKSGHLNFFCVIHSLQLCLRQSIEENTELKLLIVKCKEIVAKIKQSSSLKEKLLNLQVADNIKIPNKVIQEVCTRFDSVYLYLERIIKLKRYLKEIFFDDNRLTEIE